MTEVRREEFLHKDITDGIIAAAIKVQRALGPGLLESAYEACLVNDLVVVELKTVDRIMDLHHAQAHSYLRFSGKEVALILNFWAWPLKDGGIKRIIRTHTLPPRTSASPSPL